MAATPSSGSTETVAVPVLRAEDEAAERGIVAAPRVVAKAAGLTPEEMCFRDYLRD